MTTLDEYTYTLPPELIAQHPANPRESARLMVISPHAQEIIHSKVADFPSYLHDGDVMVINNTKVFKARLLASIQENNGKARTVELFLIKPLEGAIQEKNRSNKSIWQAIGKPGKFLSPGRIVTISDSFAGVIMEKTIGSTFTIEFALSVDEVITKANIYGSVPTPPYIKNKVNDSDYQTIYAKNVGSVAAPTAGFHITDNILTQVRSKRVQIVEITLHVGLGTFLPIKSNSIETHTMHSEWTQITQNACDVINQAKKENRRIVAIGTTTVRALEGASHIQSTTHLLPFTGDVSIFITPGFHFQIVDCLLTNFHLPKSTLLLLVSAFAGKDHIKKAYLEAVQKKYRFYSFGDAMFLEKSDNPT